jgi:hypothetical protein
LPRSTTQIVQPWAQRGDSLHQGRNAQCRGLLKARISAVLVREMYRDLRWADPRGRRHHNRPLRAHGRSVNRVRAEAWSHVAFRVQMKVQPTGVRPTRYLVPLVRYGPLHLTLAETTAHARQARWPRRGPEVIPAPQDLTADRHGIALPRRVEATGRLRPTTAQPRLPTVRLRLTMVLRVRLTDRQVVIQEAEDTLAEAEVVTPAAEAGTLEVVTLEGADNLAISEHTNAAPKERRSGSGLF